MLAWQSQYNSQSELGISQVPLCISGGSANKTQLDGQTTNRKSEACDADGESPKARPTGETWFGDGDGFSHANHFAEWIRHQSHM